MIVRCKFIERLTGNADANAERSCKTVGKTTATQCASSDGWNYLENAKRVETIITHLIALANGEGIVQTTNNLMIGGESHSGK